MNTPQERLRADFERIAKRLYSEEGIPMFLVCENLASDEQPGDAPLTRTSLNDELSSAFQRESGAWQRLHSNPPATDVGKIVEVLADRDFGVDGAGKSR